MLKILSDILTMPRAALLIFAASAGALAFVFTLQFGFGVEPCILCLWQRAPFCVAALLAFAAFLWRPFGKHTCALLALCAAAFLVNTGLAVFHTGVELHWWLGTSGCAIHPLQVDSVADLREQLLHTVVARCDQISWTLLGFSMANWNVLVSLGLALFSLAATKKSSFSDG